MALKTFNVNQDIYLRFSSFCKENGISMSKQVEFFMASQVEEDPRAREEYLKKLEQIRKGRFVKVKSFPERYGV
jgi:hypothetical protein